MSGIADERPTQDPEEHEPIEEDPEEFEPVDPDPEVLAGRDPVTARDDLAEEDDEVRTQGEEWAGAAPPAGPPEHAP